MPDALEHQAPWPRLSGTLLTITFAVTLVWLARSYGRTLGFAFGVNWFLMAWAIMLGRMLGLSLRLPASYYAMRRFEKRGRVYDYLGVRWYQRLLRPVLWTVNPGLLKSEPDARQTMIEATHDPEAGHLIIFVVITGITVWTAANRWWDSVAWLLLFNLLHNAYPVLSMRQVRARLDRKSMPGDDGRSA